MSKVKPKPAANKREIRCYLCGHRFDVSTLTMSVPCPKCNRALKVEDVVVKSYVPVNDLQTCGKITVAKNGRVVAKMIRSGEGIECEGTLEGTIETDGDMVFGPKASWKGKTLCSRRLVIAEGAQLMGAIKVPWQRVESHAGPATAPARPARTENGALSSDAIESPDEG